MTTHNTAVGARGCTRPSSVAAPPTSTSGGRASRPTAVNEAPKRKRDASPDRRNVQRPRRQPEESATTDAGGMTGLPVFPTPRMSDLQAERNRVADGERLMELWSAWTRQVDNLPELGYFLSFLDPSAIKLDPSATNINKLPSTVVIKLPRLVGWRRGCAWHLPCM